MGKTLYVDFFNEDETLAVTRNQKVIHYNLIILERVGKNPVFSVGRYVCIIMARNNSENPELDMLFMDLHKNPKLVEQIKKDNSFDQKFNTKLLNLIELYNSTYEDTKGYVTLVKGWPPNLKR